MKPPHGTSYAARLGAPFALSLLLLLSGCAIGRQPIPEGVVPPAKTPSIADEQYGHEVLAGLTKKWQLDYSHPRAGAVDRIVDRLAAGAGAAKDPWHVFLLKDDSIKNPAATRGNHVFVWTGLLNATQNDEELAAILSHEMSHVLAHHTEPDPQEEVVKVLVQVGAMAAGIAASYATRGPFARTIGDISTSAAQEVATGLFVNPYSREKEFEADQVGLFLMADSGFPPKAAVDFWNRARNDPSFGSTMAFFSTHPPAADRLRKLVQLLPRAEARYRKEEAPPRAAAQARAMPPEESPAAAAPPPPPPPAPAGPPALPPAAPASKPPASSGGFNPATDSFDMRSTPPAPAPAAAPSPAPPPPAPDKPRNDFLVVVPKAVLYSQPSLDSRPLGEFKHGSVVDVVREQGVWLEIEQPDHGFLHRGGLLPNDDHQLD